MASRQKRPLEAISGQYSAIPHQVLDSASFKDLGHPAKALLFELLRQHTGKNNGHLQLSIAWLINKRGWKSSAVIQKAKRELIDHKLIILTRQGGLNMGASQYGLTWLHITNFVGLDIQQKSYHPGAWQLMDKLPVAKTQKPYRETIQAVSSQDTVQYR